MKLALRISACLLLTGMTAFLNAQDAPKITVPGISSGAAPATATPAAPAVAPASTFTNEQILETWGWYLAQNTGIAALNFNKTEVESLSKGMALAAGGNPPPYPMDKIGPDVEKFLQKRQETVLAGLKEKGMKESASFLTEVKKKPGVTTLPDGLAYEIVKPGEGAFPKPEQTVKVHYTGTLINGNKFDSSVDRGEPAEFVLNEVIPGWTEGMQKINKGGKIKLYVPPQLAYGDEGRPGIPPASTLVFDVELIDIKDTPPPAAAAAAPGAQPQPAKK